MEKNNEFNVLRAIGALSVITIHVTSTFGTFGKDSFSYLFFESLNKFCNFAVPLFLFLSIALLINHAINKDKLNVAEFYKKRFIKTVPIFLIYVVIYYIYLKLNGKTLISITQSPWKFFSSYILQGTIYHHLYFMPIIFELYILFPVIYIITKKIRTRPAKRKQACERVPGTLLSHFDN